MQEFCCRVRGDERLPLDVVVVTPYSGIGGEGRCDEEGVVKVYTLHGFPCFREPGLDVGLGYERVLFCEEDEEFVKHLQRYTHPLSEPREVFHAFLERVRRDEDLLLEPVEERPRDAFFEEG
mgnify:CR=1 FL=1